MFTQQIIILLILLILSGFFSSAETALFSISRAKSRHLAKSANTTDQLIARMKEKPHNLLSTILIGNNLVNIGASSIATVVMFELFSSHAAWYATIIMTSLILVFGEILPKSIATKNNIGIARLVIHPIYWLSIAFFPLIKILDFIPAITGKIQRPPIITEEELITIVEVGEEEGEFKEEEKEFIQNIFEFDDTSASEIMTPRKDMFLIDIDKPMNLTEIMDSGYSRLPVIKESVDNVIGILHITDIFRQQITCGNQVDILKIMRQPYFIPENKKINTLLAQFKKRKHHMAIVVDEYGGVAGLITLEDVLEEIVGDILDERDKAEPDIIQLSENEWLIPGITDIDEVNDVICMGIDEAGDYDTFSGFFLDRIGRIPKEKERIAYQGFSITVKSMEGNRILEFMVKKNGKGENMPGLDT